MTVVILSKIDITQGHLVSGHIKFSPVISKKLLVGWFESGIKQIHILNLS